MEIKEMIRLAFEAREKAYTPYSGFKVGAALLAKNGEVYQGCNIENAGYTPTNCAERTAFFKAVSEGIMEFERIVVVGGAEGTEMGEFDLCPPCGVCRQVMREFCDPDSFEIILAKSEEEYKSYLLREILPLGFGPDKLLSSYSVMSK
ncbi:MAG: cytidine deaminase [Eubacteriales bacterium]|nr:cytidine deaminase [Eubacteriales bacterium]